MKLIQFAPLLTFLLATATKNSKCNKLTTAVKTFINCTTILLSFNTTKDSKTIQNNEQFEIGLVPIPLLNYKILHQVPSNTMYGMLENNFIQKTGLTKFRTANCWAYILSRSHIFPAFFNHYEEFDLPEFEFWRFITQPPFLHQVYSNKYLAWLGNSTSLKQELSSAFASSRYINMEFLVFDVENNSRLFLFNLFNKAWTEIVCIEPCFQEILKEVELISYFNKFKWEPVIINRTAVKEAFGENLWKPHGKFLNLRNLLDFEDILSVTIFERDVVEHALNTTLKEQYETQFFPPVRLNNLNYFNPDFVKWERRYFNFLSCYGVKRDMIGTYLLPFDTFSWALIGVCILLLFTVISIKNWPEIPNPFSSANCCKP